MFIGCLMFNRHLDHIGPTLGVDALSRHAQDIGLDRHMGSTETAACLELTIVIHLGD